MSKNTEKIDDGDDLFDGLSFSFYVDSGRKKMGKIENKQVRTEYPKVEPKTLFSKISNDDSKIINAFSPPDPFSLYSSRTKEKWADDNSTNKCKKCGTLFTFYRRRHHCYHDGDIYCDTCTSYRERIPKIIKKIPTRSGKEEPIDYNVSVRLCKHCYDFFQHIHKVEKLFIIFSLLDLTLKDLKNISLVCKQWNIISAFYLSRFRQIQYKLPRSAYDDWEKRTLWTNRYLLKGHSLWETHVIRAAANNPSKFASVVELYYGDNLNPLEIEKNHSECWNRMCSRYCTRNLDEEKALLLLNVLELGSSSANIVARKVTESFDKLDKKLFECYLTYILFKLVQTNNTILKDFIMKKCIDDIRIANICYWYFKNNSRQLFGNLIEILPKEFHTNLAKCENFVELVRNDEILCGKMVSAVSPQLGEQEIYTEKISIKESATRPIFIPCSKSSELFKRDDVRKDQTIMCVIRLMEKILKDNGLDINLVTYDVQPTSDTEGFISIVENCETLYTIQEKLKITLTNYLLKNNPNSSVSELRNKFKTSCAVYSVITFLLSISDRNTENLMLTKDGSFFHIDYSQILGQNLKPIKASCIRITPQMLEALGGENSPEYEEFKELCVKIYDILRRHFNTFACLLSMIPTFKTDSRTCPHLNEETMFQELIKRFCPGETYESAMQNLKTRIDNSTGHTTLSKDDVIDFFHKHNKEKSVQNMFYFTYSGTKNMLSAMYGYLYSFT